MWANRDNINIGDEIEWYRKSTCNFCYGIVRNFNHTYIHGYSEWEPLVEQKDGSIIVVPYNIIVRKIN